MAQMKLLDDRYKNGIWEPPTFATEGSAGIDLRAATSGYITIRPGKTAKVNTGIAIWLNDRSKVGLIFPRSGSGARGLVLGNLTGVIDQDYQGEIILVLYNRLTDEDINIAPGDRVAQYVVTNALRPQMDIVEEFSTSTQRAEGGFGSTGEK